METLDLWPPPRPRRRRRWVIVGLVVALMLAAGTALLGFRSGQADTDGVNPLVPRRSPVPSAAPTQPTTWTVKPFLPGHDIELFARSDTTLYRINPASGQVTATPTPNLGSSSDGFIVGPHQVLLPLRPDGYTVPDGQAAHSLPSALANSGQILPATNGRLWLTGPDEMTPDLTLTDMQGQPVPGSAAPPVPANVGGYFSSDGRGGLILTGTGGDYQLTPDGPRRITHGGIVAIGPHHYLTNDCDTEMKCSRYLLNRTTWQHKRLGPARPEDNFQGRQGVLSDDGRYAALWSWWRPAPAQLRVVDVATTKVITTFDDQSPQVYPDSLIWLPDNRLIGLQDGRILIYDASTGESTSPDLHLQPLTQINMRASR